MEKKILIFPFREIELLTLVDGQSLKVTSLFGIILNKYSLIVSCLGEIKQTTFFGLENFSPCMPNNFAA